jgi:ankyrin repeat protein
MIDLRRPLLSLYDAALTERLSHELRTPGNWANVKALIVQGADPNVERENGSMNALILAAVCDRPDICHFLLRHGANPNAIDAGSETALMKAARANNKELCSLLVMGGADARIVRKGAPLPYHIVSDTTALVLGTIDTQKFMMRLVRAKEWLDESLGDSQHGFYLAFMECVAQ